MINNNKLGDGVCVCMCVCVCVCGGGGDETSHINVQRFPFRLSFDSCKTVYCLAIKQTFRSTCKGMRCCLNIC